jgi:putative endonuclease
MSKAWYLYLLECKNGRIYTGITVDLAQRFDKHKNGKGAMFTRLNPPLRIIAAKLFSDRSKASKAEYMMKKLTVAQKRESAAQWPLQEKLPSIET